jgi:hypothetical protein
MPVPSSESAIDPCLIRAYRQAEYRVLGVQAMALHIDRACGDLARLHRALKVDCSAFITAYNPHSLATAAASNAERLARLAAELASRGLEPIDAIGMDPSGTWPGEPSFLAPGMSLTDTREMGVRYRQNAVVWSGSEATPRLILLR